NREDLFRNYPEWNQKASGRCWRLPRRALRAARPDASAKRLVPDQRGPRDAAALLRSCTLAGTKRNSGNARRGFSRNRGVRQTTIFSMTELLTWAVLSKLLPQLTADLDKKT